MKKRVKVEFTGDVKGFLDKNPNKKYFVCGETSHIASHTHVIKDTTLTENQIRMRDDSDGFNMKLNISISELYEEVEIEREEISFDSEKSLRTWLDANKGVKLFLDKDLKSNVYIINTEKDPYQYVSSDGHSDDMDNLWHWRVFYREASVKDSEEEEVEKELTFDKYFRMFKECTTTGQVEELNKKFMWNGKTLYEHLDSVDLPTCKLFPVGCSSIKEIEEVIEKPRKTGLVGVKQIECVLPEEGVPEEDEVYIYLDIELGDFTWNSSYYSEDLDIFRLRAGWFKKGDEEHATKYFKALLNIED